MTSRRLHLARCGGIRSSASAGGVNRDTSSRKTDWKQERTQPPRDGTRRHSEIGCEGDPCGLAGLVASVAASGQRAVPRGVRPKYSRDLRGQLDRRGRARDRARVPRVRRAVRALPAQLRGRGLRLPDSCQRSRPEGPADGQDGRRALGGRGRDGGRAGGHATHPRRRQSLRSSCCGDGFRAWSSSARTGW